MWLLCIKAEFCQIQSHTYVKDVFNTAIDNQSYSPNYCCICKLLFMNAWTDKQTKITYVCGTYSDLLLMSMLVVLIRTSYIVTRHWKGRLQITTNKVIGRKRVIHSYTKSAKQRLKKCRGTYEIPLTVIKIV